MCIEKLNTKFLGQNNIFYEKIDSTQLEIHRLIDKKDIKSGTIVIANEQTNGIRNSW